MADSVMDSIIEKPNTKAAEPKKSQPSDEDNRRNNDCRLSGPGSWASQKAVELTGRLEAPYQEGKGKKA